MRKLLFMARASLALTIASCNNAEQAKPEEMVGRVAKTYYDYLIEGKYEAFVDGFYRPDSIPGSYREQLIANAKMYMGQLDDDHKGLASVQIAGAKADTARHAGHAFLLLCFKDSTKEEVVVPMVLNKGNWMMR